jgi:hypothetical protein
MKRERRGRVFLFGAPEERGSPGLLKMLIREVHKNGRETSKMSERRYPAYSSKIEQQSIA